MFPDNQERKLHVLTTNEAARHRIAYLQSEQLERFSGGHDLRCPWPLGKAGVTLNTCEGPRKPRVQSCPEQMPNNMRSRNLFEPKEGTLVEMRCSRESKAWLGRQNKTATHYCTPSLLFSSWDLGCGNRRAGKGKERPTWRISGLFFFPLVNQSSIASREDAPARHREADTICQDSSSLAEPVSYPAKLPKSQIPIATEIGF